MAEVYDYPAGFDDPGNKNAWFGRIIGEGKRVLEVGYATGYVGEYLVQRQRCCVHGIEYVADVAERARGRGCYAQVLTGDIQDPCYCRPAGRGASLTLCCSAMCLEHLISPENALRNVAPLLAPGGHVLICVPSIIHWSLRLKILRGRFEYTESGPLDRTHVHFFTPKTARDLVQREGFRIVEESGVVWLPSPVYRLPPRVRGALERSLGRLNPDLMYGQALLDVQPVSVQPVTVPLESPRMNASRQTTSLSFSAASFDSNLPGQIAAGQHPRTDYLDLMERYPARLVTFKEVAASPSRPWCACCGAGAAPTGAWRRWGGCSRT